MSRNVRFGVQLTGDHRGAVQSMRVTQGEARRLQSQIQQTGRATDTTNTRFQTWTASLNTLRRAIGPLAGVGGVSVLGRMAQQTISGTAALQDQANTAGLNVETFQELTQGLADLGNISDSVTGGALRRFNRRMGLAREGSGAASGAFEEIGVSLEQETEPALQQVIQRLSQVEDRSDRAALASKFFGEDAGPQLAGALGQGQEALQETIEALRETNRILSEDLVESASKTDREFRRLKDEVIGTLKTEVLELNQALRESDNILRDIAFARPDYFGLIRDGVGLMQGDAPDDIRELNRALDENREQLRAMEDTAGGGFFDPAAVDQQRELVHQLERRLQVSRDLAQGTVVPDVRRATGGGRPDLPTEDFTGGRPDVTGVDLTDDQARERERRQNELIQERDRLLRQIQTPQEAYGDSVARLQRLHGEGLIDQDQFNRGLEHAAQDFKEATREAEQLNGVAEDLGFTFSSAFEDAIIQGENFRGILQGMAEDIQRIILRATVTQPMGQGFADFISGAFSGGGGGSEFQGVAAATPRTFAGGGYTGDGPRSGGLDGMGGFPAILHPRETVIDHTQGGAGAITFAPVIHVSGSGQDTEAQIDRALRRAYPEFERRIAEKQARRGRSRL